MHSSDVANVQFYKIDFLL